MMLQRACYAYLIISPPGMAEQNQRAMYKTAAVILEQKTLKRAFAVIRNGRGLNNVMGIEIMSQAVYAQAEHTQKPAHPKSVPWIAVDGVRAGDNRRLNRIRGLPGQIHTTAVKYQIQSNQ